MSGLTRKWNYRWVVITSEAIGYMLNSLSGLKEYNIYNQYSKFKMKSSKSITVRLGYRTFYMKFQDEFEFLDTIYCILRAYAGFVERKAYQFNRSLCGNDMRFYINGESEEHSYFSELFDAMEAARTEIYITDWFLAPYIYLKRPKEDFPDSRLDLTLLRACDRGVHVV